MNKPVIHHSIAQNESKSFALPGTKSVEDIKFDSSKAQGTDHRLELLLTLEGEALRAPDRRTLRHFAVNKTRRLVSHDQAIFFVTDPTPGKRGFVARSISGQAMVDRTSPLVSWLESQINAQIKPKDGDKARPITLDSETLYTDKANSGAFRYPFASGLWLGLGSNAGLLLTKSTSWHENEIRVLRRISDVYDCAWRALDPIKVRKDSPKRKTYIVRCLLGTTALVMLFPVSMTTLAPAEIVAVTPQIVTAPLDGVIAEIHVAPNAVVKKGDLLASYVATDTRNEYALMVEEMQVAEARLERTRIASFMDPDTKRDIRIMESEVELARSRLDYANERLGKAQLIADRDGIALISDPDSWTGKPVAVGERILQIANPEKVEIQIQAPVSDGELLQQGARVRMFLDAQPLKALEGELRSANHFAETTPEGTLAYTASAQLQTDTPPRLGARGIAKIHGNRAPLIVWLLRKPFVSARQFLGI